MIESVLRRARQAVRDPGWAVGALNTRMQWQRVLGFEPPEFRALAAGPLREIEGWRYRQDLALLYLLARHVPGPGVVLEIGSFKGLGTTALAYGTRDGGHESVHTVDPHTGDRQDLDAKGVPTLPSAEAFHQAMVRAGIDDEVVSYTMMSDELATQWGDRPIRVLFVDGWHSYEAVESDLRNFAPHLTPDGVVLVDDYANYDEVKQAVDDASALLPARVRRAGRMRLASPGELAAPIERFLRIPWG